MAEETSCLLPLECTEEEASSSIQDGRITSGRYVLRENTSRALTLLPLGAGLVIVGMAVALLVKPMGFSKYWWLPMAPQDVYQLNMFGEPFASGWPYVVTSVSVQIGDVQLASGKIFKASVLVGAIMIFISDYPKYLSNVCPSKNHKLPIVNSLRAYACPVSILIVVLCPITRVDSMTVGEMVVMYGFHMTGALGAIFIFVSCEFHDLNDPILALTGREKSIRTALARLVVILLVIFVIAEAIGFLGLGMCCDDIFLPITEEAIRSAAKNKAYIQEANDKTFMQKFRSMNLDPASSSPLYKGLYDTAHGPFLAVRVMGVWAEYSMFLCMLWGHIAIWYFCPEREDKEGREFAISRSLVLS